jgi:predicted nucleic acid-binding protein
VVSRPSVVAKLKLTATTTKTFFEVLCSNANLIEIPETAFHGCRDPDDNHYVNLALSLKTPVIVSRDRDLLDLAIDSNLASSSLRVLRPTLRILTPPEFIILIQE